MIRRPSGGALAGLALLAAAGGGLAGCGGRSGEGGGAPPPPAPALTAPLQTSFSAGGALYAVVAMGNLDQPSDTFWELVTRPAGSARWSVVTPPGVADNGGLAVSGLGRRLLVAFLPSRDLTFSPLATSTDAGRTWTAGGLVPSALTRVPDAIAAGGDLIALVPAGGILSGAVPGTDWGHAAGVGSVGADCAPSGLTAVAESGGTTVAGAACTRPLAGVFVRSGGHWTPAAVPLPAGLSSAPTAVLRLVAGAGGSVTGLVAGGGTQPSVVAIWSAPTGPWRVSPALALGAGAAVVATGTGAGREEVVMWRHGGGGSLQAATIAGPGAPWVALPAAPAGTQAIALGPAGTTEALAVAGPTLTVWRLAHVAGTWTAFERIPVPLQLGSSS